MSETNQSVWQQIARGLWPYYSCRGDGQYALVCPKTFSVALFDNATAGRIENMTEHENGCAVLHKKVLLHAPQSNTISRSPADAERERR
jgi:hypothetical protein